MPSVLVIDDDSSILENIQFNLELYGYHVWKASGGNEGLGLFQAHAGMIDAVITDMKMPGLSGLDVLKKILEINPFMGIIILTGHGDMDNAITAMREGAFNYLQKPFHMENLVLSLENAIQKKNILTENQRLQEELIDKNRYLQGLHDSAQRILLNYAPRELPEFSCCETAFIYRSCEKVSGDMIDVFEAGDFVFFYVSDVCSHGILAAVNTIMIKACFIQMKNTFTQADIENKLKSGFRDLNLEMCRNTPSGIFATVFAGCLDKRSRTLHYISAGHIDQYLIQKNDLVALPSTGTILGSFENADYEVSRYQLDPGDKLILFTDGLAETWEKAAPAGLNSIREAIRQKKQDPVGEIVDYLYGEVIKHAGSAFDDDLTILGLQVKPE